MFVSSFLLLLLSLLVCLVFLLLGLSPPLLAALLLLLHIHFSCLCVQRKGMRIHPGRTSSLAVAFAQLVAPCARRPLSNAEPLFGSSAGHVSSARAAGPAAAAATASTVTTTTTTTHASNGDDDRALVISRQERKRARKTRSFRRRQAPITRGQRRTLRELWPKYGLVGDFNAR